VCVALEERTLGSRNFETYPHNGIVNLDLGSKHGVASLDFERVCLYFWLCVFMHVNV
jgi:hypothetical protein